MAAIKSISAIAAKWARVTPQRAEYFTLGIQNPRRPWAASASAAEERYKAGVTTAANAGRYGKGVAATGDAGWQSKSLAKGPTRFQEGVAISAPDFEAGFAPFAQTIASTTLPPRFAKGDPRNIERVRVLATALRKRKTG